MANRPTNARVVLARAPVHATNVYLGVHPKTTRTLASSGRLVALGEYAGLIWGMGILENPVAIFQGLNRPYYGNSVDSSVYVYVNKPHTSFRYSVGDQFTDADPAQIPPPVDSVFISFVTLQKDVVDDVQTTLPRDTIGGVLLYWEWTMADSSVPHLPDGYQTRYRRTVWRRT